jgi:hypothetical protein
METPKRSRRVMPRVPPPLPGTANRWIVTNADAPPQDKSARERGLRQNDVPYVDISATIHVRMPLVRPVKPAKLGMPSIRCRRLHLTVSRAQCAWLTEQSRELPGGISEFVRRLIDAKREVRSG